MRKHTRRTVRPLIDTMRFVRVRAAKLTPAEQRAAARPAAEALADLCAGRGSERRWGDLADALNVSEVLSERGICSDAASLRRVADAQAVLAALHDRARAGRGWTLYGRELVALREGLWLHGLQLGFCSVREHEDAIAAVRERCRQALAGNAGPGVVVHASVEEPAT